MGTSPKEIGENATIGTTKEPSRFGEVVFVAVAFGAWPELAREIGPEIEGKVVADAGNLYPARDGKIAEDAIKAGGSGVFGSALTKSAGGEASTRSITDNGVGGTPIRRAVGHDDCRR